MATTLMADEQSSEFKIPIFVGFNQGQLRTQLQPGETVNAQNIVIDDGDLAVTPGYTKYVATALTSGIKTLMVFYKNNADGTQTKVLLAATSNTIYKWNTTTSAWDSIKTGLTGGQFDFINYQTGMTDLIIAGNGKDNSMKWDGTTATFVDLLGTPPKFSSIALHHERVWVTGIKDLPNRIYRSNEFNPEDWDVNVDGGAGYFEFPTWDNGVCIGVSIIQDEIVLFKNKSIFRITGTYPGEYDYYHVFSTTGVIAERTIANDKSMAFFLAKDGIYTYNGTSTTLISYPIKDVIATMNNNYADKATAVFFNNKYILAIPTGSSTVNDTVIEYDLINQNFIVKKGININTFLDYNDKLLFANDNLISGNSYVYEYNAGTTFNGTSIEAFWETPDTDWDAPNGKKICTYIYFTGKGTGDIKVDAIFLDSSGNWVPKSITKTLTSSDKVCKLRLRNKGRRFKFKFSNVAGSYFKISNIKVMMDVDLD